MFRCLWNEAPGPRRGLMRRGAGWREWPGESSRLQDTDWRAHALGGTDQYVYCIIFFGCSQNESLRCLCCSKNQTILPTNAVDSSTLNRVVYAPPYTPQRKACHHAYAGRRCAEGSVTVSPRLRSSAFPALRSSELTHEECALIAKYVMTLSRSGNPWSKSLRVRYNP